MYQIKHTNSNFFGRSSLKILIIFLLILIFVFVFGVSNSVRSLVTNTLSPFFKIGNSFYGGLGQIPKFFSDKSKLIAENTKLSFEIENLNIKVTDYESLKSENQKLREELKIKPIGDFISTSVIAKSPQIPLDSLFLDKGTKDEINNGDLVLTGERILVGKIVKVSKNRATASLNSFAGVTTYGFVARTSEPLEVEGAGGGNIETEVPIDFDIIVGDKIMVADSFNYLVAIVGVIEEDNSSGFKKVLMSLPVNISKINIVFIKPYINE